MTTQEKIRAAVLRQADIHEAEHPDILALCPDRACVLLLEICNLRDALRY